MPVAALHRGPGRLSLKLNCPGYETRIILNSSRELRRFSAMAVYTGQQGHEAMVARLEGEGFGVRVSKGRKRDQPIILAHMKWAPARRTPQ